MNVVQGVWRLPVVEPEIYPDLVRRFGVDPVADLQARWSSIGLGGAAAAVPRPVDLEEFCSRCMAGVGSSEHDCDPSVSILGDTHGAAWMPGSTETAEPGVYGHGEYAAQAPAGDPLGDPGNAVSGVPAVPLPEADAPVAAAVEPVDPETGVGPGLSLVPELTIPLVAGTPVVAPAEVDAEASSVGRFVPEFAPVVSPFALLAPAEASVDLPGDGDHAAVGAAEPWIEVDASDLAAIADDAPGTEPLPAAPPEDLAAYFAALPAMPPLGGSGSQGR